MQTLGLAVSDTNIFFTYFHKSMADDEASGAWPFIDMEPRGMVGGVLYIATHTIYKLWALWFRRRFFYVFPL